MQIGRFSFKPVQKSRTLKRLCDNCGNVTGHILAEAPYGLGIGIPFMRPTFSTHRAYAIQCPTCGDGVQISKDEAKALMR